MVRHVQKVPAPESRKAEGVCVRCHKGIKTHIGGTGFVLSCEGRRLQLFVVSMDVDGFLLRPDTNGR